MGTRMLRRLAALGTLAACLAAGDAAVAPGAHAAEPSAVVIMYHRFGEPEHPITNVSLEQFEAHLAELARGPYNVMGLPEIAKAVVEGRPLPDRTVGISVDDAYTSVIEEAWPRLKAAGMPLTVFVATDPVDKGVAGYMTWDQLRTLEREGVTIGSQTASHPHMPVISGAARKRELASSNARFEAELGETPTLFAYPYGEASLEAMKDVEAAGFSVAFGQHSGVIGSGDQIFYLPRFAMNETYGSIDRLKLAANALPLPVGDLTPADPLIGQPNPPLIGFTVDDGITGLDRLNCYASHEGKVTVERLGPRVEVRPQTAFPTGRTRLNCTMPAVGGRWHWFGRQYYNAP